MNDYRVPPDDIDNLLSREPELSATATSVRELLAEARMDPAFRRRLREGLRTEGDREIAKALGPWWRRFRLPSRRLALPLGAVAVGLAVLIVVGVLPRLPAAVAVSTSGTVVGIASTDPSQPVVLQFSSPMDHSSVAAALRISPATLVNLVWQGDSLRLEPVHGFIPNAAYVLTLDRNVAKTATGRGLSRNLTVVFGTAGWVAAAAAATPVALSPTTLTAAAGGSEAVFAFDGSVIATAASGPNPGLVRFQGSGAHVLGQATSAICISQSGRSLAYVGESGGRTNVYFAGADGTGGRAVSVDVDAGSPLGWIGDSEVVFVGGGLLKAVDATGHVRILAPNRIDASKDSVVISTGGRYVYLQAAASASGWVVDLLTGRSSHLAGLTTQPAFSADGATLVWIQAGPDGAMQLASMPSAGGAVHLAGLQIALGDQPSDLAVAPDGGRVAYSVKPAGAGGELRVANLITGATLAVSAHGIGQSPNWSPDGSRIAVLGQGRIELFGVPPPPGSALAQSVVIAFGNAQVAGDTQAMEWLAPATRNVAELPRPSRFSVVSVVNAGGSNWVAELRLVFDPLPSRPDVRVASERISLGASADGRRPVVRDVMALPAAGQTVGPHLVHIVADSGAHTIRVTYDADLNPGSVATAHVITVAGAQVASSTVYDPGTRSVTITVPALAGTAITLSVTTGLRDIAGNTLATAVTMLVAWPPPAS